MRAMKALILLTVLTSVARADFEPLFTRGVEPEQLDQSVPYECAVAVRNAPEAREAYIASAEDAIRALQGVQVLGSYEDRITLRMTPRQAEANYDVLSRYCRNVFRSHPQGRTPRTGPSTRAVTKPTFDTKEGFKAMFLDKGFQANLQLTGKGIKVGILSDSFNANKATNFPCSAVEKLTVVKDFFGEAASDEGRAMAELICYVAPDAELYFHTAEESLSMMAKGIKALKDKGCQIIVDDYSYAEEAAYSPSLVTQAIEEVVEAGVTYITLAGNADGQAWEGPAVWADMGNMVPSPTRASASGNMWHNWGTAESPAAFLKVTAGWYLGLQWNEPWSRDTEDKARASSDLDLYLCTNKPTTTADLNRCKRSTMNNVENGDPLEEIELPSKPKEGASFFVGVYRFSSSNDNLRFRLNPNLVRGTFVVEAGQGTTNGAVTGALVPHGNTESALSVGAADFRQTPALGQSPALLEKFSSWGNQKIFFDGKGTPLPASKTLLKPDIVGPDETANTFFGTEDKDGVSRFGGTSASAPHVAAVAALMLEQRPKLKPKDIYDRLRRTALDMYVGSAEGKDQPVPGPDRYTGFGYINGEAALTWCDASEPCCSNGVVAAKGTLCRPAIHPCDVADRCDGFNATCPHDANKPDRTPCSWFGKDHPWYGEHMADESPSTMVYSVHEDVSSSDLSAVVGFASDDNKLHRCSGFCQRGVCTTSTRPSYCCFSDDGDDSADYYAEAAKYYKSGHKRHNRDKKYKDSHDAEDDKRYHCWKKGGA